MARGPRNPADAHAPLHGPVRPGRQCRKCGAAALAVMRLDRRQPDERASLCRPCANSQAKAYNEDGRQREANRAYRARHPGRNAGETKDRRQRYAARSAAEVDTAWARLRPDGLKRCRACRERLPRTAFYRDSSSPDGSAEKCAGCSFFSGQVVTPDLRAEWDEWDVTGCHICEVPIAPGDMHIDHVRPASWYGPDDPWNKRPAHAWCNEAKGNVPGADWEAFYARVDG